MEKSELEKLVKQIIGDDIKNALDFFKKIQGHGLIDIYNVDIQGWIASHIPAERSTVDENPYFVLSMNLYVTDVINDKTPYKSLLEAIQTIEDLENVFNLVFDPFKYQSIHPDASLRIISRDFSKDSRMWVFSGRLFLDIKFYNSFSDGLIESNRGYVGVEISGSHFPFPAYAMRLSL